MLEKLRHIVLSGKEFLPILEGAKGIGLTNGITAGNFAKNNAIGTFSGVNPDVVDENGEKVKIIFKSKNRLERHLEMIENSINGIIAQAKIARDIAGNVGRVHVNVLWEMGATEYILHKALEKAKDLIQGIVCGAGMPYKLGEIAAKYNINYFPIVSSMRAFKILWKRSFSKTQAWLGGVVYECPWSAGGHNGLTNAEDPFIKEDPYKRIIELRAFMNEVGLKDTPIIFAGGIWNISEYKKYLDNEEIGKIAFQFGTRPLVTQESPLSIANKLKLLHLKENEIITNHFSPTGFYSSAINTELLQKLFERSDRQIDYSIIENENFPIKIIDMKTKKAFFIKKEDENNVSEWQKNNYDMILKTPDNTIVFVSNEDYNEIKQDLINCHGCLSQCQFSSWSQYAPEDNYSTKRLPDPRSFCIQKALQYAKEGTNPEQQLFFSGTCASRFATDAMYQNDYIPTIKELIETIKIGK